MQIRVLQLKLRTLNRGKAYRLETMQPAFTDAVRLHVDTADTLPKPAVTSLHGACYHAARATFPLPASPLQQARDKALAIYRGVQTRKRHGERTSRPHLHRLVPLRLAAENLRVFVEQGCVRVTTPDGFLWLPVLIPKDNPRHTSQRCSLCGHTERTNRHAQAVFQCCACAYTVHADMHTARNLAARGAGFSGTVPLNGEVL